MSIDEKFVSINLEGSHIGRKSNCDAANDIPFADPNQSSVI